MRDRTSTRSSGCAARAWPTSAVEGEGPAYVTEVKLAFHAETIALAARVAAADALIASGMADPDMVDAQRYRWYGGTEDAEPPAQRVSKDDLWRLVGATQLRMTAHSLTGLTVPDADPARAR